MPLPQLAPTTDQDAVETAFSADALGRFVANTWEEATSGGPRRCGGPWKRPASYNCAGSTRQ